MTKLTPKQLEKALRAVEEIENLIKAYDLAIAGQVSWGLSDDTIEAIYVSVDVEHQIAALIASDIWTQIHLGLDELRGLGVDVSDLENKLAVDK